MIGNVLLEVLGIQLKLFNIHGTFPSHKRFFIVEKYYLDFLNVLHANKKLLFRTVHWEVLWGTFILRVNKEPFVQRKWIL